MSKPKAQGRRLKAQLWHLDIWISFELWFLIFEISFLGPPLSIVSGLCVYMCRLARHFVLRYLKL